MLRQLHALLAASFYFFLSLSSALAEPAWKYGDLLPVTCLNRSMETGEHVADANGNLQYIPFYTCEETKEPLHLRHGVSSAQNCTIALTDPLYHLLEFYIHNDAPLTCRIPSSPNTLNRVKGVTGTEEKEDAGEGEGYTPLIIALGGQLQFSHLHVANELNLVVHTAAEPGKSKSKSKGLIDSASAYSISPALRNTKMIIGDSLTLTFHTRWYQGSYLPLTNELQRHGFWSTVGYCIFAAGASAAICIVYFRGVDLPKRLRFHGKEMLGSRRTNGTLPTYNGYGYTGPPQGVPNGNGYGGYGLSTGKWD